MQISNARSRWGSLVPRAALGTSLFLWACTTPPPPPQVLIDGCLSIDVTDQCWPDWDARDGVLTVWARHDGPPDQPFILTLDDVVVPAQAADAGAEDGTRWRVLPSATSHALTLSVGQHAAWTMKLAPQPPWLADALAAAPEDRVAAIDRVLERLPTDHQALALRLSARWAAPDASDQRARLHQALALPTDVHSDRDADVTAVFLQHLDQQQPVPTVPPLRDSQIAWDPSDALHAVMMHWALARTDQQAGRIQSATRRLRTLTTLTGRLGDPRYAVSLAQIALQLGRQHGDTTQAERLTQALLTSDLAPQPRAHLVSNLMGLTLDRHELDGSASPQELRRLSALAATLPADAGHNGAAMTLERLRLAVALGQPLNPTWIEHVRTQGDATDQLWLATVLAREATARGAWHTVLDHLPEDTLAYALPISPDVALRGVRLRLAALARLDEHDQAFVEIERLQDSVETLADLVPLQGGVLATHAHFGALAEAHAALLMQRDLPASAAATARAWRRRGLAGLLLPTAYDGSEDTGAAEQFDTALHTARVTLLNRRRLDRDLDTSPRTDRAALARRRAKAHHDAVQQLEALRALPTGGLRRPAPPQALRLALADGTVLQTTANGTTALSSGTAPVDGEHLVLLHALSHEASAQLGWPTTTPTAWSLDLRNSDLTARPTAGTVLIVSDTQGDLADARAEADTVAQTYAEAGWRVQRLDHRTATLPAVLEALPGVDALHFSGHGGFSRPAQPTAPRPGDLPTALLTAATPARAYLKLAGGDELTAAHLLSLPRGPRWVVLSGCQTARSGVGRPDDLGLAHAFVLRGADAVVAALDTVPSAQARDLAEQYVRALISDAGQPPIEAFSAAHAPVLAATSLSPYRLLVP